MSGYLKHSDLATCFFHTRSKQKPNAIHVFSPRVSVKIQFQTVVKLKNLPAEPHQTNSADLIYMFSIIVLNCLFQINCELSTTKYMHMKSAGCGWHSRWHNFHICTRIVKRCKPSRKICIQKVSICILRESVHFNKSWFWFNSYTYTNTQTLAYEWTQLCASQHNKPQRHNQIHIIGNCGKRNTTVRWTEHSEFLLSERSGQQWPEWRAFMANLE